MVDGVANRPSPIKHDIKVLLRVLLYSILEPSDCRDNGDDVKDTKCQLAVTICFLRRSEINYTLQTRYDFVGHYALTWPFNGRNMSPGITEL